MIYDVDYFISKFQAIPEDKWGVGLYEYDGKRCAVGHCGHLGGMYNVEAAELYKLIGSIIKINDGKNPEYQQPTPKQRILAALYDIKMLSKGQEVQECDATKLSKDVEAGTKIIHHYHKVTVPESIEQQTKELILS